MRATQVHYRARSDVRFGRNKAHQFCLLLLLRSRPAFLLSLPSCCFPQTSFDFRVPLPFTDPTAFDSLAETCQRRAESSVVRYRSYQGGRKRNKCNASLPFSIGPSFLPICCSAVYVPLLCPSLRYVMGVAPRQWETSEKERIVPRKLAFHAERVSLFQHRRFLGRKAAVLLRDDLPRYTFFIATDRTLALKQLKSRVNRCSR